MTTLDQLSALRREVTRLHLDTKDKPHVPEYVKSGLLTLQIELGSHIGRYLTAQSRAAQNAREVCAWFARMALRHWAETE